MLLSWSSRAGRGCATSSNTRVCITEAADIKALIRLDADSKVVYRRYASLFFVCGIGSSDNELVTLEIIHRYVEVLDRYFGNVSGTSLLLGSIANTAHTGL